MTLHRASVGVIWLVAAVGAVLALVLAAAGTRLTALTMVLGISVLLTLGVQLLVRQPKGFVSRMIASTSGALVVVAVGALLAAVLPA